MLGKQTNKNSQQRNQIMHFKFFKFLTPYMGWCIFTIAATWLREKKCIVKVLDGMTTPQVQHTLEGLCLCLKGYMICKTSLAC